MNRSQSGWTDTYATDQGSYGYDVAGTLQSSGNRHRFGGKEEQRIGSTDLKLLDFGARYYDAFACCWTALDPMAGKYPAITPYSYCAGNPVNLVDPEGLTIVIKDYAYLRNVLNTLSDVDSKQIVLTNDGTLFVNSNHMSNSKAFGALKTLSESSITYYISSSFLYNTNDGIKVFQYGDSFDKGITLMPGSQNDASPDNDVHIITNSLLDEKDQAKNLAHEAYGHAFFYERLQKGDNVNPYHQYISTYLGSIWDDEAGFAVAIKGRIDTNTMLDEQINSVVQEVESLLQNK